jgi:hypothetical protein
MACRAGEVPERKHAGDEEISAAELLPQVYDELRKLAAARMRYDTGGQPRFNVHFLEELSYPQPAAVGHTCVRSDYSVRC